MNRLLELYAQQRTHPTSAEIFCNILLDILKSGDGNVVRWRNPEILEFEVVNEVELRTYLHLRTGMCFTNLLNEGKKFVRKVPGHNNVFRFYFLQRHLLPRIPKRTFAQIVRLSTETSV
ncbi:unnamed protein product [Caenorhabditis brenneri]